MIKVKKQELFWITKKKQFYRRTELENDYVIWERPSQYGTFTNVSQDDFIYFENKYSALGGN